LPSDCVEDVTTPTQSPSQSPSAKPSEAENLVIYQSFWGPHFMSLFLDKCWIIELFDGGVIAADNSDPTCGNEDHVASFTVSSFDNDDGSKAYFTPFGRNGYSGQIAFKKDPSLTDMILEPYSAGNKMFDLALKFPSCQYGPPYPCFSKDLSGKTVYVPVMNFCLKLEMFDGGSLVVDASDPECTNSVHNGQMVASDFDYIRGNKVYYKKSGGWNGVFEFLKDDTYSELNVLSDIDGPSKEFKVTLTYPSCLVLTP